ncbi:MAG TPA: non-homologous end-joining DNA ligase [Nocardioidaceae bacterium]|nr:non-homologous end-joining DNA ligase [Nocardioidaceae bacterium]
MAQGREKVQVTPPNKVPGSYSSGKFVARAAAGRARAGLGQGFRRMGQDGAMRPMLATKATRVPTGPEWLHEVKWDGMRVLVEVRDGRLRLWSRNEKDVTVTFPELHGLADLGRDVLLDGEVVAFLDGLPTFGALGERMHVGSPRRAAALAEVNPVTLLLFDVLRLDGQDVTSRRLQERRRTLEGLGLVDTHWQVPAAYDDGEMLLDATQRQRLEGIVSKKRDSLYVPGRRTPDWLKHPNRKVDSYVVGGWRLETDSASRIGAVLVGEVTDQGLEYRGRVGSGIAGKEGQRLLEVLEPFHTDVSPFADDVPKVDAAGTTWVRPEVVVDIATLGMTPGKRLRQPSYRGVRGDLTPGDLGE